MRQSPKRRSAPEIAGQTRATVQYNDIAGLAPGAGKSGAIAGPLLNAIAASDALLHVVRAFEDNTVPLIAGKPTFVRVYVDCGEGCTSREVTGRLYAYGPSGELAGSPLTKRATVTHEAWTSQRADLRKSLNYTLPPQWLNGTITLEAAVVDGGSETRYRDPDLVVFQPAGSVRVVYAPIRSFGSLPDSESIRQAPFWALRVFPTAAINYVQGATITWNKLLAKDPEVTKPLLNELTTRYRLVNAYVFGWLPSGQDWGTADAQARRAAFAFDNGDKFHILQCQSGNLARPGFCGDERYQAGMGRLDSMPQGSCEFVPGAGGAASTHGKPSGGQDDRP